MKIEHIEKRNSFRVDTDEGIYIRNAVDCWDKRYGNSDEEIMWDEDIKLLEELFQKYIRDNNIDLNV